MVYIITQVMIPIISCIAVIVGGVFALVQWRKNVAVRKAEFFERLIEHYNQSDIQESLYCMDYDNDWYTKEFHNGSKTEQQMDKTLAFFSYLCYLNESKLISDREFNFFAYDINIMLENEQLCDYMYNLYHMAKEKSDKMPYVYFVKYFMQYHNIPDIREGDDIPDDDSNKLAFASSFCNREEYKINPKFHNYIGF